MNSIINGLFITITQSSVYSINALRYNENYVYPMKYMSDLWSQRVNYNKFIASNNG